ncbi:yfhM [Symbiodinium sp. CCMP2456]|nr:yfhM [Symbiodinium sp. CCMP2456]
MAVRPRFRIFSALVQTFVWAAVARSHSTTEDACAVSTPSANLDAGDQHDESMLIQHQGSLGASADPDALGLVQESPFANRTIHTRGFSFSCTWTPSSCSRRERGKQVLLLHGFPGWKETWLDLMKELANVGYCAAACDQRGYSPGASPPSQHDYTVRKLIGDVAGFANAFGFRRFHLVAHDIGAVISWLFLGSKRWRRRVVSFTSLAIPHPRAFSDGLFGERADLDQQAASTYFNIFTRPNSASLGNNTLYEFLGASFSPSQTSMTPPGPGWASPEAFQKPLWWYNAIIPQWMAQGPLRSVPEIAQLGFQQVAALLQLLGGSPTPGEAAQNRAASISAPTLFICGNEDRQILCAKPFSRATQQYCKGSYQFLEVTCGHDPQNCHDPDQTGIVYDAILDHIKKHSHWWYARYAYRK